MAVSIKITTARPKTRSLPPELWPDADRKAWAVACQPPRRLKRGGTAGHLKPVTRDDHAAHYGNFLGFLARNGLLQEGRPPATHVTPENVDAYLIELKNRVAPTTLHGSICKLRRTAQHIAPSLDLTWLVEICKDLALMAQPRSKFGRLVLTEVLVEAGLTLIREAEDSRTKTTLARACQVRNGLMVALLALCPVRRKNFASLEIGRSFVEINGKWWIVLSASETKEKRADERPVDELLTPAINRYLGHFRRILARSDQSPPALWLSANNGTPISDKQTANIIRASTLSTVGIAMGPHLFRTSAASSAAILNGENPHLGSALLHHMHPSVTNAHYNRASSLRAGEDFRQIVRRYQKRETGAG